MKWKTRSYWLLVGLMGLAAADLPLQSAQRWPAWQRGRVALDRRFVRDEFRIYYTLTGTNALPASTRLQGDQTGVPEKIQNIARQLVAARRCYVEVLGLRHPFDSPRYRGRVRFVDVNVWALAGKNGSAGDAIVNYHRPSDSPEGVEVLTIDLSVKLSVRNLTPAHELFHLFQNGYSQFKNPWYYEGTARWSEDLLREGAGKAGPLPADAGALEDLFKRSYDASPFWQSLARAADPAGTIPIPRELRELSYTNSPNPIIEDDIFHGARLLKALLEGLGNQSDIVSQESGLDPLDWKESRQRSPENNPYIWKVVTELKQSFPSLPRLPPADLPETSH